MVHRVYAIAVLLFACSRRSEPLTPPGGPTASVRETVDCPSQTEERIPLRNGRTLLRRLDNHLVVTAADGGLVSESSCGSGSFDYWKAVAFMKGVVRSLGAADRNRVADLLQLPMLAPTEIKTRADFLDRYEEMVTSPFLAAVQEADPRELFCRNGAFMLGDGEIWAAPDGAGGYRITTFNPTVRHRR
jgi:hypothetical protein